MKVPATPVGAALLVMLVASGCAGSGPRQPSASGPLLGTPVGGEGGAPSREQDLAPRERWGAPFAVSSAGWIARSEPRSVILLAVDSAIAAGMAAQQAIEMELPERPAPGGSEPTRIPADGAAGGRMAEPARTPEGQPDEVRRPDSRVMPAPQPG